ncbi:hypothetical protein JCM10207_001753 [Rhodosporidiobolus poonsookiae]
MAAAASVAQAGWLPPILTSAGGEVYKVGDSLTFTWDTTGYNAIASETGRFFLGYKSNSDSTTVGASFFYSFTSVLTFGPSSAHAPSTYN